MLPDDPKSPRRARVKESFMFDRPRDAVVKKRRILSCALVTIAALNLTTAPTFAAGYRAPADDPSSPRAITTACQAQVAIIGARGSGEELNSGGVGFESFGTRSNEMAKFIISRLPSSVTYRTIGLRYSAIGLDGAVKGSFYTRKNEYKSSVDGGVKLAQTIINRLAKNCPGSKIILVGYSQGADVMHSVAASYKWGTMPITGVVLIADPHQNNSSLLYSGGKKFSADSFIGIFGPGKSLSGTAGGGRTVSICNRKDWICNSGAIRVDKNPAHSNSYKTKDWLDYPAKWISAKTGVSGQAYLSAPSATVKIAGKRAILNWGAVKAPKPGLQVNAYVVQKLDDKKWKTVVTVPAATRSYRTPNLKKGKHTYRVFAKTALVTGKSSQVTFKIK